MSICVGVLSLFTGVIGAVSLTSCHYYSPDGRCTNQQMCHDYCRGSSLKDVCPLLSCSNVKISFYNSLDGFAGFDRCYSPNPILNHYMMITCEDVKYNADDYDHDFIVKSCTSMDGTCTDTCIEGYNENEDDWICNNTVAFPGADDEIPLNECVLVSGQDFMVSCVSGGDDDGSDDDGIAIGGVSGGDDDGGISGGDDDGIADDGTAIGGVSGGDDDGIADDGIAIGGVSSGDDDGIADDGSAMGGVSGGDDDGSAIKGVSGGDDDGIAIGVVIGIAAGCIAVLVFCAVIYYVNSKKQKMVEITMGEPQNL